MSLIDTIKELFGGLLGDQAQNLQDTVQSIGDNEVAQNIKDTVGSAGEQLQNTVGSAGDAAQSAGDTVQSVVDEVKNKLGR